MRVGLISDVYFPRVNGVSTSIATFRNALGKQGVDSVLIAPRYGADAETDDDSVIRLPARSVPRDPEDRLMSFRAGLAQADVLRRRGVELMHIQTPFVAHYAGIRLARRLDLPTLATYHTLFEEYLHHYVPLLPEQLTAMMARRFSRAQCNMLDQVIAPSAAMRVRLAGYGVRSPIEVLPTGIPIAAFGGGDRRRFRRRYGIDDDQPLALFVGRVAHEKNIAFLIDAVERARTTQPRLLLLIAGEGPAEGELRHLLQARGLTGAVRLVGYLDRASELPDCYAAADLFVFASRTETQGLVLLEAMAAGLPVLALACMGTRSILAPERGARIAPDNVVAFAELLSRILIDDRLRAQLANQTRSYALEWSDEAMASRLAALYRRLIDRRAAH